VFAPIGLGVGSTVHFTYRFVDRRVVWSLAWCWRTSSVTLAVTAGD